MRARNGAHFGEPQMVLHVAKDLAAARRILLGAENWAAREGLKIRKSIGQEHFEWDDGGKWEIASKSSVHGQSVSLALIDEAWAMDPDEVESGLIPTMLERMQPQMWMFSTASDKATGLMLGYRKAALDGKSKTMIAEWSAAPDADIHDPEVWRLSSPHWSEQRREWLEASQDKPTFAAEYLNRWHVDAGESFREFPDGWSKCDMAPAFTPTLAAIETSHDRSRYGVVAAARLMDGRVAIRCASATSLDGAIGLLEEFNVPDVLAGVTLKHAITEVGHWDVYPFGQTETRKATPRIQELVRDGRVVHDHDPIAASEARAAKAYSSEGGLVLSARSSESSVAVLKAAMWAIFGIDQPPFRQKQVDIF